MPIFEYVCADCERSFEKLVEPNEAVTCPSCSSERLEKQYSTFGLGATASSYPSLPQYKPSGGCCNPGGCGCKH